MTRRIRDDRGNRVYFLPPDPEEKRLYRLDTHWVFRSWDRFGFVARLLGVLAAVLLLFMITVVLLALGLGLSHRLSIAIGSIIALDIGLIAVRRAWRGSAAQEWATRRRAAGRCPACGHPIGRGPALASAADRGPLVRCPVCDGLWFDFKRQTARL